MNGIKRGCQVVLGHRLLEVRHSSEGQSTAAIFIAADDVHGDMTRGGVMLEAVENRPAGHVGQIDIERDSARGKLACQCQRGAATQGDEDLDAAVVRKVEEDAGESDVVLDDQQHCVAGLNQVAVIVDFNVVDHWRRRRGRGRRSAR